MSAPSDGRVVELLARLSAHEPLDAEERAAIAHLERLAGGGADPFARTTLPAHVTSSAVVVDERSGAVLLHLHRRLGRWLQPGGHVEPGEHPDDAAVREAVEETGVAVHHPTAGPLVIHLDEHPGPDGHVHLDLRYLLLADRDAPRAGDGEQTGDGPGPTLRWAAPSEVMIEADRSLGRAVAALQRQRH